MAQYALYMTSHPLFVTSQHSTHDIKLLYLTSHRLYLTAHPLYLCLHSQNIDHTTPIVCMITQPQYVWHDMNYIWHHIHSIWYHSTLWHHTHYTHPLYWISCPLYLWHHTNSINDITATICMISYPVYVRHSVHYIYDIIHTMYEITTLFVDYTNSAYVWHHLRYRSRHIHSITPSQNLYDFTPT